MTKVKFGRNAILSVATFLSTFARATKLTMRLHDDDINISLPQEEKKSEF